MKKKKTITKEQILQTENKKLQERIKSLELHIYHMQRSISWRFSQKTQEIIQKLFSFNPYFFHKYAVLVNSIQDLIKPPSFKGFSHIEAPPQIEFLKKKPLISVVMTTYNTEPQFLQEAVQSVIDQKYDKWELCIADGGSTNKKTLQALKKITHPQIRITFSKKRQGISEGTNVAISLAKGDYIAFMDSDDLITNTALLEIAIEINKTKSDVIYTNESLIDIQRNLLSIHNKPRFSPDYVLENNYVCHFTAYKNSFLQKLGPLDLACDGAQDHDLIIRAMKKTKSISHIPKNLYHWRATETSTAKSISNKPYVVTGGITALEKHFATIKQQAEISQTKYPGVYRIKRKILQKTLVSIIILYKDSVKLLDDCVKSIIQKSTYTNFEIICVTDQILSKREEKRKKALALLDKRIRFEYIKEPKFNFARFNNRIVREFVNGEHLIFLNDDMKVISHSWIEELLQFSQDSKVGCVGAKLLFPDDTIQHAGIWMVPDPVHIHFREERNSNTDMNKLQITQNPDAVTGACLMIKKDLFLAVKGFDEKLAIAFNDVDLCLRLNKKGFRTVWTPYAEIYHYESVTRGYDDKDPIKFKRFAKEIRYLRKKHGY